MFIIFLFYFFFFNFFRLSFIYDFFFFLKKKKCFKNRWSIKISFKISKETFTISSCIPSNSKVFSSLY